ncbi:MAG: hypothetical protein IJ767_07605 [Bacteroidaceae bacterium]|nr:hypothetical protein [Bacteroidaceae bacterium]
MPSSSRATTAFGVAEQWTGRVEATLISHLKAWGEWSEETAVQDTILNGLVGNDDDEW